MRLFTGVAEQYADFASYAGDSPCFADWAARVAEDGELQEWIAQLPPIKQQPNLVFAAARWHGVPAPGPYEGFRDALLNDDGTIVARITARSTQTNEVGRLATLAPVFARTAAETSRPLSIIEAGASAGLCLYPDRYTYRYLTGPDRTPIDWTPSDGTPADTTPTTARPVLTCRVKGAFAVPQNGFEVAWRGGIDLSPLDVRDDDEMAWLANLVWPEQHERRARLETAAEIARPEPPHLVAGDILTALPELVAEAAQYGQVVVFHSAVVAYLEPEDRERFADLMTGLVRDGACRWVSNEGAGVLPRITATGPDVPDGHPTFVLGLDGQEVAWTHGHGRSLTWHADPR